MYVVLPHWRINHITNTNNTVVYPTLDSDHLQYLPQYSSHIHYQLPGMFLRLLEHNFLFKYFKYFNWKNNASTWQREEEESKESSRCMCLRAFGVGVCMCLFVFLCQSQSVCFFTDKDFDEVWITTIKTAAVAANCSDSLFLPLVFWSGCQLCQSLHSLNTSFDSDCQWNFLVSVQWCRQSKRFSSVRLRLSEVVGDLL